MERKDVFLVGFPNGVLLLTVCFTGIVLTTGSFVFSKTFWGLASTKGFSGNLISCLAKTKLGGGIILNFFF